MERSQRDIKRSQRDRLKREEDKKMEHITYYTEINANWSPTTPSQQPSFLYSICLVIFTTGIPILQSYFGHLPILFVLLFAPKRHVNVFSEREREGLTDSREWKNLTQTDLK